MFDQFPIVVLHFFFPEAIPLDPPSRRLLLSLLCGMPILEPFHPVSLLRMEDELHMLSTEKIPRPRRTQLLNQMGQRAGDALQQCVTLSSFPMLLLARLWEAKGFSCAVARLKGILALVSLIGL
jgi:hypothetical protein